MRMGSFLLQLVTKQRQHQLESGATAAGMRKGANVSTCVDQAGGFLSSTGPLSTVSPFAQRFGSFSHSLGWVGVRERKTIDFSVY